MANVRKKKNYIYKLHSEDGIVTSNEQQHKLIYDHFQQHLGTYKPRTCTLNFSNLKWDKRNLERLDDPFTKEEIKAAIFNTNKEKAPGPDGFIGPVFHHLLGHY